MSRTSKYKIIYAGYLCVVVAGAVLITELSNRNFIVILFIALLLLVPGRIQGYYWRDFFIGRRLMSDKKFESSIPIFQRFIESLNDNPWKKKLIWANWGIYTRDIEAMAFNNIGAAYSSIGDFSRSETALNQALEIDPLCPLPYYNLAVIREFQSDRESAENYLKKSVLLGYKRTTIDMLIHEAGAVLASIEGKSENERNHSTSKTESDLEGGKIVPCEPFPSSLKRELDLTVVGGLYGLEMLNDNATPMEYVMSVLSGCLDKERSQAIELMLKVHKSGAAQILSGNESVLKSVAKHITQDAKDKNYPLSFRISKF